MGQDFRFACRQLLRQPGLSGAAVATLGLGLAASIAVFTLLNALVLRPLPYPEPERVMSLARAGSGGMGNGAHRDVRFLRDRVRTCAPMAAAVGGSGLNVSVQGRASYIDDRLVSYGYFEALGIAPRWGRAFTREDDAPVPPPVVILNERYARSQHLDPARLVGQEMLLGGRPHTIVGVVAASDTLTSDAAVYRPLGNDARGSGQNLDMLCRLAEGRTAADLDSELLSLADDARSLKLAGTQAPRAYVAVPRHEWEFGSLRSPILTLSAAVGLVLLVAAANTTGLLLVRAAGRRREIAMRAALGASPGRIARAIMAEGLVLAGVSGALGLAAAPLLVRGLLLVAPGYYVELADYSIDRMVLIVTIALCTLVGLTVSLPPLVEVLRVNLRDTLQDESARTTGSRRTMWMRQLLIGAETAVSTVLLVGALLLVRTFLNLTSTTTGFDSDGIITARMAVQGPRYDNGAELIRFFEDGVARLKQTPGIDGAAVGASVPSERALNIPVRFLDSPKPDEIVAVNWRYVTPDFFQLLHIRHVAGRPFTEADRAGAPAVALVNEAFARQTFGSVEEAIGRRIVAHPMSKDIHDPVREVVGVVADTTGWRLGDPPRPLMFVPLAQVDSGLLKSVHAFFQPRWIVRTSRGLASARRELEAVVRDLDPNLPFISVMTLDSLMLNSIGTERFYLAVLLAFAVLAVALAAIGIYAAYSYAIQSRTAEIGVRLALGAAPGQIVRRIVGQGLLFGAIAIGIGLGGAVAASRVLTGVLFGVKPTDPAIYAVVSIALLGTVLMATLWPALRAARIDPVAALRG